MFTISETLQARFDTKKGVRSVLGSYSAILLISSKEMKANN